MAITDAQATKLNKSMRAAQDVSLGTLVQAIGTIADLDTTSTNLVGAINEVDGNVGVLSTLTTTAKTSAVAAINEVNALLVSYVKLFHVAGADAVAASTTGVHDAVVDTGSEQTITTDITDPAIPRNITATAGGTSGDIGAIQVTINGTNIDDEVISEDLPAFTVDTPGTVTGSKAFKTVTSIVIPAHDGTGATTAIGFGDKLGLADALSRNTVIFAFLDNTKESTDPTVAVSSSAFESNTVDLNSALDGTDVDAYYLVG